VLSNCYLCLGRTAVKVRPLNDKELAFLRYSAEHYVRVKSNYAVAYSTTTGTRCAKPHISS
jgi:carbonic anhydrase/acetyltransferase-like protein (isoleucine patch superfamily)